MQLAPAPKSENLEDAGSRATIKVAVKQHSVKHAAPLEKRIGPPKRFANKGRRHRNNLPSALHSQVYGSAPLPKTFEPLLVSPRDEMQEDFEEVSTLGWCLRAGGRWFLWPKKPGAA